MWSCGGDSCTFCKLGPGASRSEGAVRGNPGGSGGNIAVQKEKRREGGEEHRVVLGDTEEDKKINGTTNADTCTSIVRAHSGVDKKAKPRITSSSSWHR